MIEIKIDVCDLTSLLATFTKKEAPKDSEDHIGLGYLRARLDELKISLTKKSQECDDLMMRLSRYEAIPGFAAPSEPLPMHSMTRPEAASSIGQMLCHLRSGQKIEAIKIVKKLTGCGLKEAKDACDNYWNR